MKMRIKELREAAGMTQENLAEKAGVSRGTIVRLEKGSAETTTTETLSKIADALGRKVSEIFFE